MISRLVLFGATGDLAGRFLLPALAALRASRRVPDDFAVLATAPEPWDEETFRRHAAERLAEHDVAPADRDALLQTLRYRPADATDAAAVAELVAAAGPGPLAAYVALPPALFGQVVAALGAAGQPGRAREAVRREPRRRRAPQPRRGRDLRRGG